jgi:hypothetical protein
MAQERLGLFQQTTDFSTQRQVQRLTLTVSSPAGSKNSGYFVEALATVPAGQYLENTTTTFSTPWNVSSPTPSLNVQDFSSNYAAWLTTYRKTPTQYALRLAINPNAGSSAVTPAITGSAIIDLSLMPV